MQKEGVDTAIKEALIAVKKFGLQRVLDSPKVVSSVKSVLSTKTQLADDDRRNKACQKLFKELTSRLDLIPDMIFSATLCATEKQISMDKATVYLTRELVFAVAASL